MSTSCWGVKGTVFFQRLTKLDEHTYRLVAELAVSWDDGLAVSLSIRSALWSSRCVSSQRESSFSLTPVKRCLNSQTLLFIFIFWHLETPLENSIVLCLNYFMIRIGKYPPGRGRGSYLPVSATGHIIKESLRILGFSSVKRGQNHRVSKGA